jgi:hypothetical protein
MKRIAKFPVLILSLLIITAASRPAESRISPKFIPLTTKLPAVDKVELQKVSGEYLIDKVLATKTLEGRDAQAVARLWRSQKYGGRNYSCHLPVYAVKFYSRGNCLFTQASAGNATMLFSSNPIPNPRWALAQKTQWVVACSICSKRRFHNDESSNNSLDRSGGRVFRIKLGAAKVE